MSKVLTGHRCPPLTLRPMCFIDPEPALFMIVSCVRMYKLILDPKKILTQGGSGSNTLRVLQ